MAVIAVQTTDRTGITPVYASAAEAGDSFVNSSAEVVHFKNGHDSSITVTFATPGTVDGLAIADRTLAIPAGAERVIGPFPTGVYNDGNGRVNMTYSVHTALTFSVIRRGQ